MPKSDNNVNIVREGQGSSYMSSPYTTAYTTISEDKSDGYVMCESERKFNEKMLKAKQDFEKIVKDKINPYHNSQYADLDQYIEKAKAVLFPLGINFKQVVSYDPETQCATCVTSFADTIDGWREEDETLVPAKNAAPQDSGSAKSYAKRYSIAAIMLQPGDVDDDANQSQDASKKQKEQEAKNPMEKDSKSRPPERFNPANDGHKAALRTELTTVGFKPEKGNKEYADAYTTVAMSLNGEPVTKIKKYVQNYLDSKK